MDLQLAPQYRFLLTPQEFRLVSKALRGVEMMPEEKQEAATLQEKMLTVRAAQAKIFLENVQKDAENVEDRR